MAKGKKKAAPVMVVESRVKDFIKSEADVNVAGDFVSGLNEKVASMITGAVDRCTGNGRKTVRPVDL